MRLKWSKKSIDLAVHYTVEEPGRDPDRVHVWLLDLDHPSPSQPLRSVLSPGELGLANRLKDPLHRRRSVARHSLTRQVLGSALGVQPEDLSFVQGICGKPRVDSPGRLGGGPSGLNFNISHSENILAIAVAYSLDVGVDLEVVDLAKGSRAFYEAWTAQEAAAKLAGFGVATRGGTLILRAFTSRCMDLDFGGKEIALTVAVASPSEPT
jgi:phosphopantetheinyl transferase